MTTKTATALLPKALSVPLLLVGPLLSIIFVHSGMAAHALPAIAVGPASWTALALWSPSPISIPALIMQDVRDAYGISMRGVAGTLKRGVLITFWLAGKESPVRGEMVASLVGFFAALLMVLH
jgi:hypothetical protein